MPPTQRSIRPGNCRSESLDSLQHLSSDGLMRSWLPTYASVVGRVTKAGGGAAAPAGGGTVLTPGAGGAGGSCYITLYRVQVPKWFKARCARSWGAGGGGRAAARHWRC